MKSVRFFVVFVFALSIAVSASAMQNCPMNKKGDMADTLNQAAAALKDSNPELSGKLSALVSQCCQMGLHKDVPAASAEHPTEYPAS